MNRQDALKLLISASTHMRLKAARFLAKEADVADMQLLIAARHQEADFYVKASLDRAITRLHDAQAIQLDDTIDEAENEDPGRRQVHARAAERFAGILLHEIASPMGLLAYEASREVPNYLNSRTKVRISTLQLVLSAIEQLRKASATPKPTEFDLSELIRDIVATEFEGVTPTIALHGPTPMLLKSDPALLRFAICNGMRNAVEAVASAPEADRSPVAITWGETNVDYWIAILDKGPGIATAVETLRGIGKTTKTGHRGFGLPIATAAMEALGGVVTLESVVSGGAKFELRWEK